MAREKIKTLTLAKNLYKHLDEITEIRDYFGLLAAFAMAKVAVAGKDEEAMQIAKAYLNRYPDNINHPHYFFEAYRCGGNGRAFLCMEGEYPECTELIREYAEKTLNAPRNYKGIICDPNPNGTHQIWIDVVMAITPFMLFAGVALNEKKYIDYAAEQCILMYEEFLDPTCGLLHQSKGKFPDYEKMSEDHWGRGNGWCMMGFADLLDYLPKDSPYYEKTLKYYKDFCKNLLPHQSIRGLWRQEIPMEGAWEETSGTALIAYGIGVGVRLGILGEEYKKAFEKAIQGLCDYCITDDFGTENGVQGMCCPGEGEDKGTIHAYLTAVRPIHDEHHSHGSIMLALCEAYKNGITEIDRMMNPPYMKKG
ncbi:MAG: hypothetical protein E7329_05550 [Clostridiales bacterium]|nr:hypothetical protein [Clostridiales bacterium]